VSTTETPVQQEGRSSVEIAQTAKGDPIVKVKVYVDGVTIFDPQSAANEAVRLFNDVRGKVK
jgi:hypothetical protein